LPDSLKRLPATGFPRRRFAALVHLWCVTIHPFDDGNGRIARAIADWQLVRIPERAPDANAYVERFMRSMKEEYPDRIMSIGERHYFVRLTEPTVCKVILPSLITNVSAA